MAVVKPPGVERFGPLTLVGVQRQHNPAQETAALSRGIVAQWGDYLARRTPPRGSAAKFDYGVFHRMADGAVKFDYFSGVLADGNAPLPAGFTRLTLPSLYCAVFQHTGHVSGIRDALHEIFGTILPQADLAPADDAPGVPEVVERYGARFDHKTGSGGFELLVPLKE